MRLTGAALPSDSCLTCFAIAWEVGQRPLDVFVHASACTRLRADGNRFDLFSRGIFALGSTGYGQGHLNCGCAGVLRFRRFSFSCFGTAWDFIGACCLDGQRERALEELSFRNVDGQRPRGGETGCGRGPSRSRRRSACSSRTFITKADSKVLSLDSPAFLRWILVSSPGVVYLGRLFVSL